MKTPVALLALVLLAAPVANAGATTTVTFELTAGSHLLPSYKTCEVTFATGGNAGDVLDAAVASGCISNWEHDSFGTARYVTCIDGLCQQPGTFWAFYQNDVLPQGGSAGIDDVQPQDGDVIEFVHADWFTPFLSLP